MEFPDGVVGIVGRNGSGKSSLVESIAWAIYGNESSIVRTSKEGVKYSGAYPNEECSVTLQFELEGEEYRLQRAMRGVRNTLDASLTVNGKLLAKGDRAVTDAMVDRLGMDHRAFFVSVFAKQKELNALSSLRSEERRKLIRRMLDIDVLDRVVTEIDKEARMIDSELKALQASLLTSEGVPKKRMLESELEEARKKMAVTGSLVSSLTDELDSIEEEVERLKASRSEIAERQGAYGRAKEDCTRLSAEASAQRRHLASLQAEVRLLQDKSGMLASLASSAAEYDRAVEQREGLERSMRLSDEKRSLSLRARALEEEIGRLKDAIRQGEADLAEIGRPSESLQKVETNIGELAERAKTRSGEAKGRESETRLIAREVGSLRSKLGNVSTLGPDSSCPLCERRMGDYFEHLTKKLEGEIGEKERERETLDAERRRLEGEAAQLLNRKDVLELRRVKLTKDREKEVGLTSRLSSWGEQVAEKEGERERLSARSEEIGDVDFDEEDYKKLKGRIAELKQAADAHRTLAAQLQRLPSLQRDESVAKSTLAETESRLRQATENLRGVGYKEGDLEAAQSKVDLAASSAMAKSKEIALQRSEMAAVQSEVAGLRLRLDDLQECEGRASECSSRYQRQTFLSDLMREFRSEVIARITPALSEISSGLFAELTDGKYAGLELSDEYDIEVLDDGKKYELARFSGGEADLANLCLRLAISKLIAERAGSELNFLILDEIFGSQDQVRKRNIVSAFNQLSRQFSQIMLITHVEDVKDMLGGAIMVSENDDGTSGLSLLS